MKKIIKNLAHLSLMTTICLSSTNLTYAQSENAVDAEGEVVFISGVAIRSECPGEVHVIQVVPEGTVVRKGDFLVEMDTSAFEKNAEEKKLVFRMALADRESAQARLEQIQNTYAQNRQILGKFKDVANAEKEALVGNNGELVLERKRVERQIERLSKRLEIATKAKAEWTKQRRTADAPPIPLEIELEIVDSESGIEEAKEKLRFLQGPRLKMELARLELEHTTRELEMVRQMEESESRLKEARAALEAIESKCDLAKRQLEQVQDLIQKCRIIAPVDGTVAYSRTVGRRIDEFVLEEGAVVRERQSLMLLLPENGTVGVEVLVHESQISRVTTGQAAIVTVSALADKELAGEVKRVSLLPEPIGWGQEDKSRKYRVLVKITDPPKVMRQGMHAKVVVNVGSN